MRRAALILLAAGISLGIPAGRAFAAAQQSADGAESAESADGADAGDAVQEPGVIRGKGRIVTLQIPQKLEVVLNPWEMDGKPQVYSEKYVVRNGCGAAGTLTLSGCRCFSPGGVVRVETDAERIRVDDEKAVYMELEFGNGDVCVLSEEGSEYEVRLESGEEMEFWFSGGLNEEAAGKWAKGDVSVTVTYSWRMDEAPAGAGGLEETGGDSDGESEEQ